MEDSLPPDSLEPGSMEIAFVTPRFHPHVGGIEEATLQMAAGLRSRGHRVVVHTMQTPGLATRDEHGGLPILRYPATKDRGYYASRFEPDISAGIIHMHAYAHQTHDWVIDRYEGRAKLFLSTHHGARFPKSSLLKRLYHAWYNRSTGLPNLRRLDGVLCPTTYDAQYFVDRGIDLARVHVLPSGVAEHAFEYQASWTPPGVDAEKGFFLYLGRLHPEKGLRDLVTAYRSIRLPWSLVLAGRDEGMADELKQVSKSDPRIRVLTTFTNSQKWGLIAASSCLVLPSHHEGQGLVVAEAWAQRKPVIASMAGALPSLIEDRADGILVPVSDTWALAREMRAVATDSGLARRLGLNGRRKAEQYYRWEPILDQLEALYAPSAEETLADSSGTPEAPTTDA